MLWSAETFLTTCLRGPNMQSYEELLKKAKKELPETASAAERFTIDKVSGHIQGNKTVLSNLHKIAKHLERNTDHLLKYLQKELATPAKIVGQRIIFNAKLPASQINRKIKQYAQEFLFCPTCGKPETKLVKERDISYLQCQACGDKHVVKSI